MLIRRTKERKCASVRADSSVSEISRQSGIRESTVRRILKLSEERGERICFLCGKLGF